MGSPAPYSYHPRQPVQQQNDQELDDHFLSPRENLPSWTNQFFADSDDFSSSERSWMALDETSTIDPMTPSEIWEWSWDRTVKTIVLSPIVIFTIVGNFLVLYAFVTRKRELRAPTHFFIANLSLADFLVGIMAMPFLATVHVTDRWYFGSGFCYAWVIIHFWLCSASILSTLAVCVERYVGVKYPLRHVEIMSVPRVIAIMVGVWSTAGFLTLLSVLAFPEPRDDSVGKFGCKINNQIGHVLIATIGILYIPAGFMIFLYWRIYVIASTHLKSMKNRVGDVTKVDQPRAPRPRSKTKTWSKLNFFRLSGPASTSTSAPPENSYSTSDIERNVENSTSESGFSSYIPDESSTTVLPTNNKPVSNTTLKQSTLPPSSPSTKQINLARRLAFLVGILLLSYIPFFSAFLIRAFNVEAIPNPLFTVLGWIRYANSAINPIIYAFAVPAYRKAFENILHLGWRKQ